MIKHLFSAGDMADILSVSKPSIAKWVNDGKIECNEKDEESGKYHFTMNDIKNNVKYNNRKRPIVTTFGNVKGGVGKTTIVVNIGITTAEMGYRVLIVDTDKQGNSTDFFLEKKPSPIEETILNIFTEDRAGEEVIRKTNFKNIQIIPCNLKFGEIIHNQKFETYFKLRDYLKIYKENFDFVYIDTPPDISLPTESAIIASDYVIGVTDPDTWGLEGIINLKNKALAIKNTNNPSLKIPGFIFNKVFEHRRLDAGLVNFAKETLEGIPRIKTKIPLIQGYKEAINEKRSIFDKDLDEKYKDIITDLTVEVLGVIS